MGKTVANLLAEVSWQELQEWHAYYKVEPFGEQRADIRAGLICTVIANSAFGRKKGSKAYQIKDFLLFQDTEHSSPKKQSVEEMKHLLMGLVKETSKNVRISGKHSNTATARQQAVNKRRERSRKNTPKRIQRGEQD